MQKKLLMMLCISLLITAPACRDKSTKKTYHKETTEKYNPHSNKSTKTKRTKEIKEKKTPRNDYQTTTIKKQTEDTVTKKQVVK